MSAQVDARPANDATQLRCTGLERALDSGALAVLPVAVLALAMLWWPEQNDMTLFRLAAVQLNHGAVYYRDFWDIKQPGIYWFYQLGELVIPGGLGVRVLEILLAVAAAVLVTRITAGWQLRRSVRLAAPTIVLAPYLIWSFTDGVGQIEGLMNFLLLTVLAATWPVGRGSSAHEAAAHARVRPGWAWFAAGLAIGAVILLKTLYLPIPLILLATAAWSSWQIDRRRTAIGIGWAAVGVVLPVIAAVGYLAEQGVLDLALRTTFELPAQVAKIPDTHNPSSRHELEQAIKNMFPVIGPLAVIGLLTGRRRGQPLLAVALTASATTAFVLALPQLWTAYRLLMLAAPLGLLAVGGLEWVLAWFQAHRAVRGSRRFAGVLTLQALATLALIGLTLPILRQPGNLILHAGQRPWGLDQRSRIGRGADGPWLKSMSAAVQPQLKPGAQIYVMGDPRLTALLNADSGATIAGSSLTMMPPIVWNELDRELTLSRPTLIFVDSRDWSAARAGAGRQVFALIARDYRAMLSTVNGTWYQTDHPGEPVSQVGGNEMFAGS